MKFRPAVVVLSLGVIFVAAAFAQMNGWGSEQSAARTEQCVELHGAAADVSLEPEYDAEWVHRWAFEDGCHVRKDVIMTREGEGSCGGTRSSEIALGAQDDKPAADYLSYRRDPERVFNDEAVSAAFNSDVSLPISAVDTGYEQNDRRLWTVPHSSEFIYVQIDDRFERWPFDPSPPGCE
jgi:hypothetical protein